MKTADKEIKSCVIWTRVSTKYQEDNGGSLQYQKDCCEKYAKTPGAYIKEMIKYLKKDKSVNYILVTDRQIFTKCRSRNINV